MSILVTGAAGFIGYHVCEALLARGDAVVGVDNFAPFYSLELKRARLAELMRRDGFRFIEVDIADPGALVDALEGSETPRVVHLAAQPGVRYSLEHPFAYASSNLTGHLSLLEYCRHRPAFRHLVYASSSSVYGNSSKLPFHEADRIDAPISLYAATKVADELMSHAYASLYGLPQTGLRFFTVYGPWGRPDMAVWRFTEAIFEGRPIEVYNHGDMRRDFTYVDDVVAGVLGALDRTPDADGLPHRIFNIGNNRAEPLPRLIEVLERAIGRRAETVMLPMQPGDVRETYADISAAEAALGFRPATPIEVGLPRFVEWYRGYRGIQA